MGIFAAKRVTKILFISAMIVGGGMTYADAKQKNSSATEQSANTTELCGSTDTDCMHAHPDKYICSRSSTHHTRNMQCVPK